MIEVEIDDRELQRLIRESDAMSKRVLSILADDVTYDWSEAMKGSERGESGRSLPGEAPAVDLGDLINSLAYNVTADEARLIGNEYGVYVDENRNRPFIDDGLPGDADIMRVMRAVWGAGLD